ncbi:GntR family transcriptional regulator [Agromyces sp. SYSU T00194]|uniref:GntR family transcriptional regulator n=1 Tax=Agromyces chitinivorans TaxID=3158560 RepID=UPI003395D646
MHIVDPVAPQQVKDLVYERLRSALITQEFAPGEPLREARLTEMFGVSKTPIREALVRLQQDGLVEMAPYRGARASVYDAASLHAIHEAREILEAECVRRAASGRKGAARSIAAELTETVYRARKALGDGDIGAAAAQLDAFDEILLRQIEGNVLLADVLRRVMAHLARVGRIELTESVILASLAQHEPIIDAIRDQQPEAAVARLREHLADVSAHTFASMGF